MKYLTAWLNRVTMYRLVLYYLEALFAAAVILSLFNILPYNPLHLIGTNIILFLTCVGANWGFSKLFRVKTNFESPLISAMILTLILGPDLSLGRIGLYVFAAFVAMASKYLIVWQKRHIFNPAAFGAVASALIIGEGASWWIGNGQMFPFIVIGGIILLMKVRRFHLVGAFLLTYFVVLSIVTLVQGTNVSLLPNLLLVTLFNSPILYFAFAMLTEPLTSPPDRKLRIYYGIAIAVMLVLIQTFVISISYSLELALLLGNLVFRIIRPDPKLLLTLKRVDTFAPAIQGYWFDSVKPVSWVAGQFLEWTLSHPHADSRGMRRYFTIASSPTEKEVLLVTKHPAENESSFKAALKAMKPGDELTVSRLEGEFVLPKDDMPIVFIAGGIGITPMRSMVKYLLDTQQKKQITLLYSARTADEFVFTDIFEQAQNQFGLKPVYVVSENPPANWTGKTGFIDSSMIQTEVPEYKTSRFYISGPEPMVMAFEKMIAQMGVPKKQIIRDYFPGYTDTHRA